MAYDALNDPEFDAIKARIDSAGDEDTAEQLAADIGARRDAAEHPVRRFALNLPKNIGIGAWKALVNTVDTLSDVASEANPQALAAKAVGGEEMRKMASPSLSEEHPELMKSLRDFTSQWERNDTLSDDLTQGVAQFALPFLGWMKLAGGVGSATKMATAGKALAAEAGTAASAFDAHDGRFADLIDMGLESETRFGTLLRKVAPDESLMNQYINYMTDRTNEGVAEGRFKNAVDAVVSSAALGGVLKTAAGTMKFGKFLLEDAGVSGIGPGGQKGMVAFHGTPHDFDAFDLSKIGTGEGNQVYGHGLYFAEAEGTAKHYRGTLSRRAFTPGSAMENAYSAMENANWDAKQAYTTLMQKAVKTTDPEWKQTLISSADKIKAGNVKQLGKLMTVDIPDEAVASMMDWDKPLSEQPEVVAKLKKSPVWNDLVNDWRTSVARVSLPTSEEAMLSRTKGADVHGILLDSYKDDSEAVSRALNELGIPGIRYLDQQSRGKAKGTNNIVLFDDKLVTITKKE